jgi:hypothetical protein
MWTLRSYGTPDASVAEAGAYTTEQDRDRRMSSFSDFSFAFFSSPCSLYFFCLFLLALLFLVLSCPLPFRSRLPLPYLFFLCKAQDRNTRISGIGERDDAEN